MKITDNTIKSTKTKTLYKITTVNNTTRNSIKWDTNTTHTLPRVENPKLYTDQVLHAYTNPNLAILLNPIHGNYQPFNLWEAKGVIVVQDWGKVGCFKLTTTKKLKIPTWYNNKDTRWRVQLQFAILCAEEVLEYWTAEYPEDNRPALAILAAKNYLADPSKENKDKAEAAGNAVRVANVTYYINDAICDVNSIIWSAANSAYYIADAIYCSANAANAAYSAYCAADTAKEKSINFSALADKAVKMVMGRN